MNAMLFIYILKKYGLQCLIDYYVHCNNIQKYVNTGFQFTPVFTNERSIATYMTNYMYDKHLQIFNCSYINEFSLKLFKPFTTAKVKSILKKYNLKISASKLKASYTKMIPDALFAFDNDGAFLEYKVCDHFMLSLLAEDFLKFLLYTDGYNRPVTFVFIMFKTIKGKLNLLNTSSVVNAIDFTNLDIATELASLAPKYSIFYFVKNGMVFIDKRVELYIMFLLIIIINKILKEINDKASSIQFSYKMIDFVQNPLVENMNLFGQNVIISRIVFDNYKYIKKAYESIKANTGIISQLRIDKKATIYFNDIIDNQNRNAQHYNDIKQILKEESLKINRLSHDTSIKRSRLIIILIYIFVKEELKNQKLVEQMSKSLENDKEYFDILYGLYSKNSDWQKNANSLAIFLIIYIVKLFAVICDTKKDPIELNKEYLNFKDKKHLFECILDLNKLLDDESEDLLLNCEQVSVSELLDKTVNKIFKRYAQKELTTIYF